MIKVNLVADMDCDRCGRPAVIFQPYSGLSLCAHHLIDDIRRKSKRTVRIHSWIKPGDRIAFPCSEDPSGIALQDFIRALVNGRKDISTAGIVPEQYDTTGFRPGKSGADQEEVSRLHGRDRFQETNDPFRELNEREQILRQAAKRENATVLAMPYTLEDHAEWALWKAVCGEIPGPRGAGRMRGTAFRVIRPFMHIPAAELAIYGQTVAGMVSPGTGGCEQLSRESLIGRLLEEFSLGHPGARFALVNIWDDISGLAGHQGCDTSPGER